MTRHAPAVLRDKRIRSLTLAGLSVQQISVEERCTPRTVSRSRVRTGCARPAQKRLTVIELTRALSLLEDGCSYAEAARTIGRSPCVLRKAFPGYAWSPSEVGQYGGLQSAIARRGLL